MSPDVLHVLCAGACQSLLNAVRPQMEAFALQVDFGPVGRLSALLREGNAADVLLSSRVAMDALVTDGYVEAASIRPVGLVETAAAVCSTALGAALAATGDPASFVGALRDVAHLYLPDTHRATAGRQVRRLFEVQGVAQAFAPRVRELPSGAAAVARMVEDGFVSAVAFAQRTEIVATPGAWYAAGLPRGYALVTEYCSALVHKSTVHPRAPAFLAAFEALATAAPQRRLGFAQAA